MEPEHNPKVTWPLPNKASKNRSTRDESQIIGKGAERIAHPSTNNQTGQKFVTKIPLSIDDPILTDQSTCKYVVSTYNCANKLCQAYNSHFPQAQSVEFVKVSSVRDAEIPEDAPKQRYFIQEKFLDNGDFIKWNNNFGLIAPAAKKDEIQAFAHFVYHHTKGMRMILDLQGVYYSGLDKYVLTDPAFISSSPSGGLCGPTDLGNHAIFNFFTMHDEATCKQMMCKDLTRPDLLSLDRVALGELLGDENQTKRSGKSTQSLTIAQTYKNTAKAILKCPSIVKKTLKVSQILGMGQSHITYMKMQTEAIAQKAPTQLSTNVFDQLDSIDTQLAPNHTKGADPKQENAGNLDKEALMQIADNW